MKFEEAKEKIRQTLEKYESSISVDGVEVSTDITYQNGNWEDCAENDKKLRLMSGEIFLRHKALSEEQALGFTMIVDCKHKNYISERDVESEIEGFCASVDDLIAQLTVSDDVEAKFAEISQRTEEESQALTEEFNAQLAKINRTLDILKITTIVIAVLGIITVIITTFAKLS